MTRQSISLIPPLCLLLFIGFGFGFRLTPVNGSNDSNNDDEIAQKLAEGQDKVKEMAEEALLNGTRLPAMDIMSILAHTDRDVAYLGTQIPTC